MWATSAVAWGYTSAEELLLLRRGDLGSLVPAG